jgi:hypothetical protein
MLRWPLIPFVFAAVLDAQTTAGPGSPAIGTAATPPTGSPPHLARIDRIGLREHATWLADDQRQGRYTSSKGQQAAAKYIAEHFQKLGLKPLGDKKGYLQVYPLRRVGIDPSTVMQFGDTKVTTKFAVLPGGDDDKVTLTGRFVWCGNGTAEQVPAGLEGKLPLVVLHKLPRAQGVGGDLQAVQRLRDVAQKLGKQGAAAGIVCLLDDKTSYGNTLNYHGLLPDHPKLQFGGGGGGEGRGIPLFVLSAEQSLPLLAHVGITLGDDGGPTTGIVHEKATGKLTLVIKSDDKATGSNVVAVLEGKGKKGEAVVFSAHHDHVGQRLDGDSFNGADDNASGTAGLLEIAEAFAKGGERPERSIVFLSVSGEELGLWGSEWFGEHPTWPLDRIVANVNIDMIGRAGGDGDRIAMQVTPSHQHDKYSSIVRDAVARGANFGIEFTSGDQYYQRSDHYNFAKRGVPVVFFCDGEHPDYHQVTDHADRLDYGRMEAVARLAFWTGWEVAQAKGKPQELGKQPDW